MSGDRDDRPPSADDLDDGIEREDASEGSGGTEVASHGEGDVRDLEDSHQDPNPNQPLSLSQDPPDDVAEDHGDDVAEDRAYDSGDEAGDSPIVTVGGDHRSGARPKLEVLGGDERSAGTIIAVAAGRGGAGKSLLAANMAVYLAQIGKRVVVVDADPAGGALNHMLGTPRPARGFGSFLRGRAETLDELAVDTPVAGVRLVAGEALAFASPRPKPSAKAVLTALRALPADTVVVDLGPPDSPLCIDVWLGADTSILVTLADAASIESTYRFLKSCFLRRLRGERGIDKLYAQLGRPLPTALDLYRVALETGRSGREDESPPAQQASLDLGAATAARPGAVKPMGSKAPSKMPALASTLAQAIAGFRPRFVVTQTRSLGDTKLGPQMAMAAHRRLGHSLDYLGHVESDETVAAAARRHRPVMAEFPEAKICKNIERIVRRILSTDAEKPPVATIPRLEEEQTFYEILDTEPGVSDEEIRRAYRLLKEIYVSSSPVIAGLFEESELAALHVRAGAAHDTLFAPERRRLYDLSLPEADLARAVRRAARTARVDATAVGPSGPPAAAGAAPFEAATNDADAAANAEVSGPMLRRVRESRGLELSEIAQRTKISERYLRSIEDEKFDELPAPVYVRGFVGQMARLLRIDPARTVEGYLRRFHEANGAGPRTPILKEL